MKRNIFICSLMYLLCIGGLFALPVHGDAPHAQKVRTELMKQKRDFLVQELNLTDDEANKLMPILQNLDDKRFDLWKSTSQMRKRIKENDKSITKEEMDNYMQQVSENKIRDAEYERDCINECKAVLPMDKVVRLLQANRKFARKFMQNH